MNLRIVRIADRGVPNQERLHLKASSKTDLCFFVVFDTVRTAPDKVSVKPKNVHWFSSKVIDVGDSVVLYTGSGTPNETRNPDGSKNHFFYWGLSSTIWNASESCAILLEIQNWETTA